MCIYLSTLTGGGRALDTSEPLFPVVGMMVSPSDLSLSTKLSTSFPLAPSLRALLGPLGLERKVRHHVWTVVFNHYTSTSMMFKTTMTGHCASYTEEIQKYFLELYLTGAGVILGFSGSTMVSVMMDPEEMLVMPALPKPPKAGTFFPERSASLLACCSSLAFLLISALASLSWVCGSTKQL